MRVFIIAEAGVNHNGSIEIAEEMVEIASSSGVDAVKFQTFVAEEEVSKYASKAEYQKKNTGTSESQLEMIKKLELNKNEHLRLINLCTKYEIEFMSSAFDFTSIRLLDELNVGKLKIPSGEITNLPYLRQIGKLGKPVILSTGMASLKEIETALEVLEISGTRRNKITVLHCNTEYPTPFEDVNLNAMITIRDSLGVKIGYSDHTLGIEVSIAAVAMGATIIEKHFTLDRTLQGPDHQASLEPKELKAMVTAIRNIEQAMGDGKKRPSPSEMKNKLIARKSLIAAKEIQAGETFTLENLTVKRPGTGISPMCWDEVLGKKAKRNFLPDELIRL